MNPDEIAKKYGGEVSADDIAAKYGGVQSSEDMPPVQTPAPKEGNMLTEVLDYATIGHPIITAVNKIGWLKSGNIVLDLANSVLNGVVPVAKDISDAVASTAGKLGTDWKNSRIQSALEKKYDDPNTIDSDKVLIAKKMEDQAIDYIDTMSKLEEQKPTLAKFGADTVQSFANVASTMFGPGWLNAAKGGATMAAGSVASGEIKKVAGESERSQTSIIGGGIVDGLIGTLLNKFFTPGENKGSLARALIGKPRAAAYLEQKAAETIAETTELLPSLRAKAGEATPEGYLSDVYKTNKKDLYDSAAEVFETNKKRSEDFIEGTITKKVDPEQLQNSIENRVAEVTDKAWKVKNEKYGNVFNDTQTPVDTTPIVKTIDDVIDGLGRSSELSEESAKMVAKYTKLKNSILGGNRNPEFFIVDGNKIKNPRFNPEDVSTYSINDVDKAFATLWKDSTGIGNKFDKQILKSFQESINKAVAKDPAKVAALQDAQTFFETQLAERQKGYVNVWKEVDGLDQLDDAMAFFQKKGVTEAQVNRFYEEIGPGLRANFQDAMSNKVISSAKTAVNREGEVVIDPKKLGTLIAAFRSKNLITARQAAELKGFSEAVGTTFDDFLKQNDRAEWAEMFGKRTTKEMKDTAETIHRLEKANINVEDPSQFANSILKVKSPEQLDEVLKLLKDDEKEALTTLIFNDIKETSENLINKDPESAAKAIISQFNGMKTFIGKKLFTPDRLGAIESWVNETIEMEGKKKLTSDKLRASLSLLMGTLQAGSGYPGAISSFYFGVKGFKPTGGLSEAKDFLIEREGFDADWKKTVVDARNVLRSEKLKILIPGMLNPQEQEYINSSEEVMGRPSTDEEKEQLLQQYNSNQ
jgi:CRISPR/Cas system CSM-associated protein Csm2 small subunit